MVPDILLFPHCDLHMALNGGAPALEVRVMLRTHRAPPRLDYLLENVTPSPECHFDFFAPYQAAGSRLANLPSVDRNTGRVTATTAGIYLFQVRFGNHYLVGRLQVHNEILGWWFGNDSITTAVDPAFAHAQPSIFASFSTDPTGADTVGDITGHGYVNLVPNTPGVVDLGDNGRLRGVSEGTGTVTGTFGGRSLSLAVRAVDYARTRDELELVRLANLDAPGEAHNMLFVGEGFRENVEDRKIFDQVVTTAVEELFSKPRHQPYALLGKSFNVWKTYQASPDHGVTCAYRVNDADAAGGVLPAGNPIPYERNAGKDATKYTVSALVALVGLPRINETDGLGDLITRWKGQSLDPALDTNRIDAPLVDGWKSQRGTSLLQERDTLFGFRLGARPGDRRSGGSDPVVEPPASDATTDVHLRPFVKRVYEFFSMEASRSMLLDPRRHAPEVLADPWGNGNPGTPAMRLLAGLRWKFPPHHAIGPEWEPDLRESAVPPAAPFKRSRGLVAVVVNEGLYGGANLCAGTMTSNSIGDDTKILHAPPGAGNVRIARRIFPAAFTPVVASCINIIAHEFGHSFGLLDEYEDLDGAAPEAKRNRDLNGDNVASIGFIFNRGTVVGPDVVLAVEEIAPEKVKWLELPRIKIASALSATGVASVGQALVKVDPASMASWVEAKAKGIRVHLRARVFSPDGRQLPFGAADGVYQKNLSIDSIDEAQGTITLSLGAFTAGMPLLERGAVLFVPRLRKDGSVATVVEQKVLAKMAALHFALNRDAVNVTLSDEPDEPLDIAGYSPPCDAYKVIAVYEGAAHRSALYYRPAGACKMRTKDEAKHSDGAFCHVCKWLIVNRVNPSLHPVLDDKFYPNAKKGGDD